MNITDLLTELGIPFRMPGSHHHVRDGWVGLDCPVCSPGSNRYRLGINQQSLAVSCWQCGRLRLGDVLAQASGRKLGEILQRLPEITRKAVPPKQTYYTQYREPLGVEPLLGPHRRYLEKRKLDPDFVAETYGVRGIGREGRLKWRIFIPVFRDGKPVSWTTRSIGKNNLRYISADPRDEACPLKQTLFGIDFVKHTAIIVEGPFDALRIGPGAVATYGLVYSQSQVRRLSEIPTRVIAFDSDQASQRRAVQLARDLAPFPGETFVVQLSGKDPGDSPEAEIQELRKRFLN